MPKVVPSQVVTFIRESFPGFRRDDDRGETMYMEASHASVVGPLVAMVEQIPDELLALIDPSEHTAFVAAVASCRHALNSWSFGSHPAYQFRLTGLRAFRRHPVIIIRDVLERCPDSAPAVTVRSFAFLNDPDLEEDLRLDLSHAHAELGNREYKSATVLGGATIEALLFWAVGHKLSDVPAALTAIKRPHLSLNLKGLGLDDLLRVAEHLGIVSKETAKAADAAKDFRNLIHPERASRHGAKSNEATAMSSIAAVLHTIDSLEKWNAAGRP